ncbi:MAG: VOC family protein [Longimicrobiales bacterium]
MSDPEGRFVWYDLVTTDPEAAVPFYEDVVGWGTTEWRNPEGGSSYRMWANGQETVGGVMALPEQARSSGAPPHWMLYIASPEIDETVARAQELGGSVIVPVSRIPSIGRFAVLLDPQGAMFAVFASDGDFPGHEGPPNTGEFSWHELATTDPVAAFAFYSELFGWVKTTEMDMGPDGIYQMFGQTSDIPSGGIYRKNDQMPVSAWLPYALVDNVRTAAERTTGGGGQILNGPMEVPGGEWIVQCQDPQGAMFALHSRTAN